MPEDLDKRMWRQIKGAFGVKKIIYCAGDTDLQLALQSIPEGMDRVFLEPKGLRSITEMPSGDCCFITGNTAMSNMRYAKPNETYYILTPNETDLYPHNAAAIALAVRYGQ